MQLSPILSYLLSSALLFLATLLSAPLVKAESLDPATSQQELAELSALSTDTMETVVMGAVAYNYHAPILADRGAPPGRRGGGSRGCLAHNESLGNGNGQKICNADTVDESSLPLRLTALTPATRIPFNNPSDIAEDFESVLSLTTQTRPTFWFHVPYDLNTITLEFTLRDEDDHIIYQTTLSDHHSGSRGIVQITLPEHAPALQLNNHYKWSLSAELAPQASEAIPGSKGRVDEIFGAIEYVSLDPSLQLPIAEALPREQAVLYANNGLWQEAITLLGELYRADPNNINLANDWYSLLESVNLAEFAQQPFVDCCTL